MTVSDADTVRVPSVALIATLRLRRVAVVVIGNDAVRAPAATTTLAGTVASAVLDEASTAFRDVLLRIPQLAMLTATVWRLANELRKTQRRVNALQHIFIPQYKDQIDFIVSSLEEREREETFRLKWLKTKMENKEEEALAEA